MEDIICDLEKIKLNRPYLLNKLSEKIRNQLPKEQDLPICSPRYFYDEFDSAGYSSPVKHDSIRLYKLSKYDAFLLDNPICEGWTWNSIVEKLGNQLSEFSNYYIKTPIFMWRYVELPENFETGGWRWNIMSNQWDYIDKIINEENCIATWSFSEQKWMQLCNICNVDRTILNYCDCDLK
jgi:hypothetical protein